MVRLPRNKKQTYRLNSRAQMWPSGLTLAMTLTLNFQGEIQNLLYLSHKWSDCHETKSKHIDWTLGLKCDHRVWLWPWPWPWIFKVKYRICCISAKIGQIASKRKANISIELQASNVTNGFELDLNLEIWRSNVTLTFDHTNQWPRFLIMEAADENVPLNLNAFVLKKAIDGMANAELDNVKPMKSGRVFIEVETRQQCKNLLKTTKLLGYLPVKVSPHRTLNSSKFVIKCEELDKMEEDEIKKELQPQGIIAVKRISIRYSLYVLTIKGQTVPKRINIGYLKKETRPYIPNPQRCFQCQKFGHTKNSCKGKAVCAGCGEEGHNLDDCKNEPKCVNCQGDHVAISRDCPKWKIEKDIVTLKYTEKISFADARKRLQPSFDTSKDSYATVTQTPPQSSRPLPPWAKKIRLPIDFRTEIEYLKYILNYCLTRLDTLDEITPENPVPRVAPSDETPHPPQTTPEQQNETTILNSESTLQSAASNDDENEIEMLTMSNKRTIHEDSSEEDTNSPLPAKKAATSSPASEQSGTRVPKGRGGGDLSKISTFPANAPQPRGRGSSQGDKSPARAPRFSNNTSEGSASSAQGGRNRAAINRQSLSKPPGTIKTATKDKTKSKGKNTNS